MEQVIGWAFIVVLLPVAAALIGGALYGIARETVEAAVERHVDKPHAKRR
jgi:hypothetical protein